MKIRQNAAALLPHDAKRPGKAHSPKFRATVQRSAKIKRPTKATLKIARDTNILKLVINELKRQGRNGEQRNMKLIYLVMTSRLLNKPVSLFMKGSSSGGKSSLVEAVAKLFSPQCYLDMTSMTDMALPYLEDSLSHRIVIVFEADGMSPKVQYYIRTLLSEGRIKHTFVQGGKTKTVIKNGPVGLITTTTALKLHAENETRAISSTIDDSASLTSAVMRQQLSDKSGQAGRVKPWRAFQNLLAKQPNRVSVPFGDALGSLIPPLSVRLRRDAATIRALVEAHAVLHQWSRQRDKSGNIVATLEDYRAVRALVHDLMEEGVQSAVPKIVRETVLAVEECAKQSRPVSLPTLARKLQVDISTVSRRVNAAVDLNLLTNQEKQKGRPANLVRTGPLPEDVGLLPTVKALRLAMSSGNT